MQIIIENTPENIVDLPRIKATGRKFEKAYGKKVQSTICMPLLYIEIGYWENL